MKKYYVNVNSKGTAHWFKDAERSILHREDGPAIEWGDGTKGWYTNGKPHREDGPAIEYANGTKQWWVNGKLHREDGPAIEWANGSKEWYIDGKELTEEEFLSRTQPAEELTVAQIEQLLGKRIKVIK